MKFPPEIERVGFRRWCVVVPYQKGREVLDAAGRTLTVPMAAHCAVVRSRRAAQRAVRQFERQIATEGMS